MTVTLYDMPKVDLKSKIHIKSNNQQANLEFMMDQIAKMYQEDVNIENDPIVLRVKDKEKSQC